VPGLSSGSPWIFAGNQFGSIDFPRVFLRDRTWVSSTSRHSDYRYYDEKTIPFAITGEPISSETPRLITSRTARNSAKFFDPPSPPRIPLLPPSFFPPPPPHPASPNRRPAGTALRDNPLRTLYSRNGHFVFPGCSKHVAYTLPVRSIQSKLACPPIGKLTPLTAKVKGQSTKNRRVQFPFKVIEP